MSPAPGRVPRGIATAGRLLCGLATAVGLVVVGCGSTPTGGSVGVSGVTGPAGTAETTPETAGQGGMAGAEREGSGRLITRHIPLSGVTALMIDTNFVVRVRVGEPAQGTVSMDDNLADLIDTEVIGGQLHLGLKLGATIRNATLSAELTVPHLERITTSGASRITLTSALTGRVVRLDASGESQITGPLSVDRAEAAATGASMLAFSGHVGGLDLTGAGASSLNLTDWAVRDLHATLSGASQAVITVQDTLAARATGSSTLRYNGAPRITRRQTSGAGTITAQ